MKEVRIKLQSLMAIFDYLKCLETGTIRSYHEKHESTRHISEVLGDKGKLISVDLNPDAIKISKDICKKSTNVEWVLMHSHDFLKDDNNEYQFVLLDSVNRAEDVWKEFELVAKRVSLNGVIMVDDAGVDLNKNEDSTPAKKGIKINSFLKENGFDYSIVRGGHGTQIYLKMTKENKEKIDNLL
jgi:predicted O-methyltransferase YrrM